MLYQTLLMGKNPYHAACSEMSAFKEHRHPEIELHYCLEGSYFLKINKNEYRIQKGDLVVIGAMSSHEIPQNSKENRRVLVIEAGPMLLSDYFEPFSQKASSNPILKLEESDSAFRSVLEETAMHIESRSDFSELLIKGNIFKVCGYTLNKITSYNDTDHSTKALRSISNVEKAIDMIYSHFSEPLDIETIASLCGYSKSHFCKIFKNITGETFHNVLNNHRLKIACSLLKETDLSVETIATKCGFADSKSFCRVFKQIFGITPGNYRNTSK